VRQQAGKGTTDEGVENGEFEIRKRKEPEKEKNKTINNALRLCTQLVQSHQPVIGMNAWKLESVDETDCEGQQNADRFLASISPAATNSIEWWGQVFFPLCSMSCPSFTNFRFCLTSSHA